MSNQSSSDLFNNFEIPAFDAGTTVPAQTLPKEVTTTTNDLMPMYIGAGVAVFVLIVIVFDSPGYILILVVDTPKPPAANTLKGIKIIVNNKIIKYFFFISFPPLSFS